MPSNDARKTAICTRCGKTVPYKTKKPKYCPECRKKVHPKPKTVRRVRRIPKHSKKEALLSQLIMEIFPETEVIINGYYSWLPSPKGAPMQLDVYVPALRLAFEYDGKQHVQYSEYIFGPGKAGRARFEYVQLCDRLKDELCTRTGVKLIRIRYDRTITKEYLLRRMENEGVLAKARALTRVNEGDGT